MFSRDLDAYEWHLLNGGAPFGGPHDASIREACEGYMAVVTQMRAALHTICGLSHQDVQEPFGVLLGRIHSVARRAVEPTDERT